MELVNKPYQPISCDYYDELTLLIMNKKLVQIKFLDNSSLISISDVLTDLETHQKEEFVHLMSGIKIRLDRLVEVDGKVLTNYC